MLVLLHGEKPVLSEAEAEADVTLLAKATTEIVYFIINLLNAVSCLRFQPPSRDKLI